MTTTTRIFRPLTVNFVLFLVLPWSTVPSHSFMWTSPFTLSESRWSFGVRIANVGTNGATKRTRKSTQTTTPSRSRKIITCGTSPRKLQSSLSSPLVLSLSFSDDNENDNRLHDDEQPQDSSSASNYDQRMGDNDDDDDDDDEKEEPRRPSSKTKQRRSGSTKKNRVNDDDDDDDEQSSTTNNMTENSSLASDDEASLDLAVKS